jgi:predicted HAD superfamily Cof-like phosphohydrolase
MKKLMRKISAKLFGSEINDIIELNKKFGMMISDEPVYLTKRLLTERADFMQEELDEFKKAIATMDIAELADALIDIVYVAKGTAIKAGLPWEDLWNDVHKCNMAKVRGTTKRGNAVDLMKPHGWKPPATYEILLRNGHAPEKFGREVGDHLILDESTFHDYV